MKKNAADREFRQLKGQIAQIDEIIKHTKTNALWEHEASLRKKIKSLNQLQNKGINGFSQVYNRYLDAFRYVSNRLIEDYNEKNSTDFNLEQVVKGNFQAFLKSGIISVLISKHIPQLVAEQFDRLFPDNPKDEYEDARKIERKIFLHLGETNTGKTYNAIERLKSEQKGIYLSPLRILALENYERLNKEGVLCNLLTGEEEIIIEEAEHSSCTIEKLNLNEEYEPAVIDEIQMINDDQRGQAWTRALLGLKCKEIHICGALNTKELLIEILEDLGDYYEIREYKRDIPLIVEDKPFAYKEIEEGDALVVFSKKKVLGLGQHFGHRGIKASLIYGDLPPEVRKKQYEDFINKETKILISTDAIGMGVNLPIKRIVFMDIKKFDGNEVRFLNSQEVKQIGGRAGRKGIYDEGYIASIGNTQDFIINNLQCEDDRVYESVLGPSEIILKIRNIPLKEKLALWSTRDVKSPYYRKMDISEYLLKLDSIKGYKLDEKVQWKLMNIPFDIGERELMITFLDYIDEIFLLKKEEISKPKYSIEDLSQLELYYQKINLYYSFGKNFKVTFDEEWIKVERERVSEKINLKLKKIAL